MAVAAPHDAGFGQWRRRRLVTCLMTVAASVPLGVSPVAVDLRDRSAARNVIDVHRRKTALVVMRVPERKLLAAMRRAERVVNVEDLQLARLRASCRTDQAEPQTAAPPRSCSAHSPDERWSIATPAVPLFRTAADRDLHQRIMPQPVEVDGVLVAARDRRRARHHHLEHGVPDAVRIAAIRHRFRKPPAHPKLALRLSTASEPPSDD